MTDHDFFAAVAGGIPPITPPDGPVTREKPRPDMSLMRKAMGLPAEPESRLSPLFAEITNNRPDAQRADQENCNG